MKSTRPRRPAAATHTTARLRHAASSRPFIQEQAQRPPAGDALLTTLVSAAPTGHALTPLDPIPSSGYQSRCRRCRLTVWLGETGLIYSLLPDHCPAGDS